MRGPPTPPTRCPLASWHLSYQLPFSTFHVSGIVLNILHIWTHLILTLPRFQMRKWMQLKDLSRADFPRGDSSSHPRQPGRVRSLSLRVRCWRDVANSSLTISFAQARSRVVQSSHCTEEKTKAHGWEMACQKSQTRRLGV